MTITMWWLHLGLQVWPFEWFSYCSFWWCVCQWYYSLVWLTWRRMIDSFFPPSLFLPLFAQITPDLAPKDELTPVALSILRQMKSTATTGTCILYCHVTCMWLLHSYGGNGGPISAGVHWPRNQESEPVECVKSSLCSGNAHSYNFIVNWFSGNNLPDC